MAVGVGKRSYTLDPVTFEVLKNAFSTTVDQMAEQILRTCYSFVIYARDFSSALCDRDGNTIMQGSQDIAVHVGTLHFTCKAVIEAFADDINPGDVFAVNDPYVGGTHFNDVRIVRPIFYEGEIIAYAQSNGHWADVGGSVPGSFDVNAKEHFAEGDPSAARSNLGSWPLSRRRRTADRLQHPRAGRRRGRSTRAGFCHSRGRAGDPAASRQVRDRVDPDRVPGGAGLRRAPHPPAGRRATRRRLGDGGLHRLRPVDRRGPHPGQGQDNNRGRPALVRPDGLSTPPSAASSCGVVRLLCVIAGTKTFFPDVPLNSGFYRAVEVDLGPVGSVVNAPWPIAVTGFCAGPYEKIMNSIFELWSELQPERALACSFNLEYLLVGGRVTPAMRAAPICMWYDLRVGGWGGRNGKDGSNATAPIFGVGACRPAAGGAENGCAPSSRPVTRSVPTPAGRDGCRAAAASGRKGAILREAEAR